MSTGRYLTLLLFFYFTTGYGQAQNNLYIQLTNNEIIYYRLDKSPALTFNTDDLTIQTTQDSQKHIPLTEIKKIVYNISFATATPDNIIGPIAIYNLFGHHITTIDKPESIEKQNIPQGIYILQGQNITKKISVQ